MDSRATWKSTEVSPRSAQLWCRKCLGSIEFDTNKLKAISLDQLDFLGCVGSKSLVLVTKARVVNSGYLFADNS